MTMDSDEDFALVVQTETGSRDVVISKTALRTLSKRSGASPTDIARIFRDELEAAVARKIAKGRAGDGQIRLHGTDL
jgi:AraC-like DNA-binding protein